ncbi:MAG: hypothetical protein KBT45_00015 [Bacteroidales bacterium]|nr:hypothetical protein [Candidatus Colimorpha pelethequi]
MVFGVDSTGKETDCETGFSYFGARYYDPTLLTSFLSIDRYADKYPSLSPYHYCAWNPIKLTDPSGDTVTFSGNKVLQQQALKWMNNASNHLAYSLNENGTLIGNLKPGVKMEDLSGADKHMLAIIGDSHNNVKIDLQDNDEISNGYYINNVAQWNGTTICRPDDNTQIITGNQVVNVLGLEDWQQRSDSPRLAGQIIYHEIAEGYASCLLSRSENRALSPFSETSSADYIKCHSNANDYFWGNVRCDPKTNKIELNYYIL